MIGAGTNVMVCDYQYAGRGRRGRHWISPYARNLAFSFGIIAPKSPARAWVALVAWLDWHTAMRLKI